MTRVVNVICAVSILCWTGLCWSRPVYVYDPSLGGYGLRQSKADVNTTGTVNIPAGATYRIGGVDVVTTAAMAFRTINAPSGTDPIADALADTLNLTAGALMGVTGTAATDTVDIAVTDAEILALGGLASAADKLPYFTGSGTAALADFTATGRDIIDSASPTTARSAIDAQQYDYDLTVLAGIAFQQGDVLYVNGLGELARLAKSTTAGHFLGNTGADNAPVWSTPAGTTAGANPTASVGLAAVNGVATTFLRSDGAPALSQAITPTWTNTHTFNAGFTGTTATLTGLVTFTTTQMIDLWDAVKELRAMVVEKGLHKGGA